MKRSILSVALLLLSLAQISAQDTTVTKKTLTYKQVSGRDLKMFMFYTEASQRKNNNVAVVLFHGGGWVFGNPSEFFEACKRYARMGYTTFPSTTGFAGMQTVVIRILLLRPSNPRRMPARLFAG